MKRKKFLKRENYENINDDLGFDFGVVDHKKYWLEDVGYEEKESKYRGNGVYSPAYVGRMHNSISEGKTSFVSSSGNVYKSAQFKGSSKSSLTGKTIMRGGFGSTGRSFGVGS